MKVKIYRSEKSPSEGVARFIFIPADKDPEDLPEDVLAVLGKLEMTDLIELRPGENRVGLEADKAIKNIREPG